MFRGTLIPLFLFVIVAAAALPETDKCRIYSGDCELCTDMFGCYYCGLENGTKVCVAAFADINTQCPFLVLSRAFCSTDGLSLSPPVGNNQLQQVFGSTHGIAVMTLIIIVAFIVMIAGCITATCCPDRYGAAPTCFCAPCEKRFSKW